MDGAFGRVVVQFHVPQVGSQSQSILETDLGEEGHGQLLLNEFDLDQELIGLMLNLGEKARIEAEGIGNVREEHALGYHGDEAGVLQVGETGGRAAQMLHRLGAIDQDVALLKEGLWYPEQLALLLLRVLIGGSLQQEVQLVGGAVLDGGFQSHGLALSDLFTWSAEEGGKASFQMERYNDLLKVYNAKLFFMKGCPSFDNGLVYGDVTKSSIDSINNLFDTDPTDLGGWSHFEMNLGSAVANANAAIGSEYFKSELGSFEISDESQKHIAMYNPMYYIKDFSGVAKEGMLVNRYADDLYGSSDVAPYWHLRVGTWDHLVSPASETAFSLTLNSSDAVKECNFMIYWDQPHTGWFDNTEMVAWLLSLPELQ